MQPRPCQDATAEAMPATIVLDPAKLLGGLPSAAGAVASGVKQVGLKEIPFPDQPQPLELRAA